MTVRIQIGPPPTNQPLVTGGNITAVWANWLTTLWNRTGGTSVSSTGSIAIPAAGAILSTGSALAAWPQGQDCPARWFHPGVGAASQIEMLQSVNETLTIPANGAGWTFLANTLPAESVAFTFETYNGSAWSNLATLTVSTAGSLSVSAFSTATLTPGMGWKLQGPATADTTMADWSWALMFERD